MPRERSGRRRVIRLALVCSIALIVMAASLYVVLSQQDADKPSSQRATALSVAARPT